MELAFAGLHQLCAPMFGRLGSLAEPQRHALSAAFGFASGDSSDRGASSLLVHQGGPGQRPGPYPGAMGPPGA
jgi:hypothetical protein